MVWVRSEYAGELAVLATWLSALLPWSASGIQATISGQQVTVINIRFILLQFHYVFGISFAEQSIGEMIALVHEIPSVWLFGGTRVPGNQNFEATIWLGGAVLYLGLLGFSVAYYAREDAVTEHLQVDPVRLIGAWLAVIALVFSAVFALIRVHQFTIPVGVLFLWVFAFLLLGVDRS